MAVHFPIALFLAAVIAEFMFAATGAEMFRHAVRFMIWGATIGALLAAPLGWLFAASGPTEEGWVLETHRWTGVGAAFFGMAVLWMCERAERTGASRIALRVTLIAQGSLVSAAGFLGGSLLYGIDHLWKGI